MVGARRNNYFVTDNYCVLRAYYAKPQLTLKKTLLHATSTRPQTDITPSPAHTSYSLIEHSTSPSIGRLQQVHNSIRVAVSILCPSGAPTRASAVGICHADMWITEIRLLRLSHKVTYAYYANDILLYTIATHSLAHNTLPALQQTSTHSASAPIAFSPRIHNIKVDKFYLLENGHVSPNGNPLFYPYLTLPSYQARTSVVGARSHNHFVASSKRIY